MKPRQSNVAVEYNDDDEREIIKMEVSQRGLPALIGLLTGIYNDPPLAVIREYTTNAIDANIESGTDRLVEVYLPSELGEPEFVVKDYGPGMGPEEVRNTYSKYVESTKRHTNDVAGMFGIGSKSALAYTGQFTVRSVKDGKATVMTFSRTATVPEIDMKVYATNDPNGTTVKVPVSDKNEFNYKARQHYKFLEPGVVLVDGEDLGGGHYDVDLGDGVIVSNSIKKNYVLMGNVPYPLPDDIGMTVTDRYGHRRDERKTKGNFILKVDLGEFMPAPPREGLELNTKDKNRIKNLLVSADERYMKYLMKDYDNAKTVMEALQAQNDLNSVLRNMNRDLKKKFGTVEVTPYSTYVDGVLWDHNKSTKGYYGSRSEKTRSVDNGRLLRHGVTFFYNADDEISDYYHRKARDWMDSEGLPSATYYAFKNKSSIPSGYPAEKIKDFAEVKNWSRPSSGSGAASTSGEWKEIIAAPYPDNWHKSRVPFSWRNTESIKIGNHGKRELVYVSPSDYDDGVTIGMIQMAVAADDVCLIKLGKNRWNKLTEDFPKATHIKDWYKSERDRRIKGFTEDHFRERAHLLPDLDSDLHRRYNERAKKINKLRKEAENKLGSSQLQSLSTGHDPTLAKLQDEINKRYPYAPTSRFYSGRSIKQANIYIKAMDLYYKENENDNTN